MAEKVTEKREVTIPLGNYLFIQDGTSGRIKTHVGPIVVNLTGNDVPVIYKKGDAGAGQFVACESLEQAMRPSYVVPEGFYAVLMNPAKEGGRVDGHPADGATSAAPELNIGHKIVIQGPKMFALWPGQHAKVVRGHSLRSNQYVLGRVYNEKEARANWKTATITVAAKGAESSAPVEGEQAPDLKRDLSPKPEQPAKSGELPMPADLTVGTLFIIKGTDVSFYIPPTGITVVPDRDNVSNTSGGGYTRDAVSLEQLEYCILVDENGSKRIPRGPAVVFPLPTETFVVGKDGELKYRAIELNDIQGVHIKVTCAYEDVLLGKKFDEGDEFFLTGKECPIYFPRKEHALVRYDGNTKHFGVAIPSGEARYVMDRNTGAIRTVHGPAMLLPNPVNEVIVRRVLTLRECSLWYPGNQEAMAYNQMLFELAKRAPTTRSGVVSEGEVDRATKRRGGGGERLNLGEPATKGIMPQNMVAAAMYSSAPSMRSFVSNDSSSAAGEELSRSSSYTAPRTLTLNTKFEGVPRICIFTGFAVLVVNSKGDRRVEIGPKTILLEYDETLEILSLSTGKPKTTDNLLETPYLRVMHNKVSDIVEVETGDHVTVQMKMSYHVDFLGGQEKSWWNVQNYIKHACDHMRSALKGEARKMTIEAFYGNPLAVVRRVVLGEDGAGYTFEQNGMKVNDVELMVVALPDATIRGLIVKMQQDSVQRSLLVTDATAKLDATKKLESLAAEEQRVKTATELENRRLDLVKLDARIKGDLAAIASDLQVVKEKIGLRSKQEDLDDLAFLRDQERERQATDAVLAEAEKKQQQVIALLKAEAEALANKFGSIKDGLAEALLVLSNNETMAKIAQATSVQRIMGGEDVVATLTNMFQGLGLDKAMQLVASHTGKGSNGKSLPAPASE